MENSDIWENSYPIQTFMCGAARKIRLTAIAHCLQECAGRHAAHYHLGYEGMKKNKQAWVLNRLRIQVHRYLEWQATLHVRTWVQLMRGPFSQRMFLLLDDKEEVIGSASSFWVVLDTESHKPQRLKASIDNLPVLPDETAPCGMAGKLIEPEGLSLIGKHTVKPSDLDLLHHVNNVKYLEWILDTKSPDRQNPTQVDLNFTHETQLDEVVEIYKSDKAYQLTSDKGQEICKAQFVF